MRTHRPKNGSVPLPTGVPWSPPANCRPTCGRKKSERACLWRWECAINHRIQKPRSDQETTMKQQRNRMVAAAVGLFLFAGQASAQWPWPYPYSVGNLGPGYYLQGSASVINSVGNLYTQQEQARIM